MRAYSPVETLPYFNAGAPQRAPQHPPVTVTHEQYIAAIQALAVSMATLDDATRARLLSPKVVYGVGHGQGARGLTYYGAWQNGTRHDVIEICAAGEESDTQIAGTTIHELGHVLAGASAGHGKDWKSACKTLGLVNAEAGGQSYQSGSFAEPLWARIVALPLPNDGKPVLRGNGLPLGTPKPCPLGIGTKGGTSRGKGSGSRLRLYHCDCQPPVKVRVASDDFAAHCDHCHGAFTRQTTKGD